MSSDDSEYDLLTWTRDEHLAEAARLLECIPVVDSEDHREYAYEVLRFENQMQGIGHLLFAQLCPVAASLTTEDGKQ